MNYRNRIKLLLAIQAFVWASSIVIAAKADDPLRDVITNTMLDMGESHAKVIVPEKPAKPSGVQVCNADLSKCYYVMLAPAPAKVSKPKLTK